MDVACNTDGVFPTVRVYANNHPDRIMVALSMFTVIKP